MASVGRRSGSRRTLPRRRRTLLAIAGIAAIVMPLAASPAIARTAPHRTLHPSPRIHPTVTETRVASLRDVAGLPAWPTESAALPFLGLAAARPAAVGRQAGSASAAPGPSPALAAPVTGSVKLLTQFPGLTMSEAGSLYPADPWVAVNAAYVIQVVNSAMRITDRSGALVMTAPTASLFAVPDGFEASDARIVWDPTHGRWVGVAVIFPGDQTFSDNLLGLVISDTSDPTGGWRLVLIDYAQLLPDYPSFATSDDKILLTADVFEPANAMAYDGADYETFTWASILGGGALIVNGCSDTTVIHARAARPQSAGGDIHVIAEDAELATMAHPIYYRVKGSGACTDYVDFEDLRTSLDYEPFAYNQVPSPRQPGGTLGAAIDERPTDAVWRAGSLWYVTTRPVSYDGNATFNDEVAVYRIVTHAVGSVPTAGDSYRVDPGDGIDAYMGGIGTSGDGTAFLTYSQSSSSAYISWWANRLFTGGTLATPLKLASSTTAFGFPRWGDFAGVALDPVGTGTVWATHMLPGAGGSWITSVVRLLVDTGKPTTPGAPTASPVLNQIVGSPRFKLSWTAAKDTSTGAVTYWLEEQVDGGTWGRGTTLTTNSTTRTLVVGHTYRYRVEALDVLGKASAFATGPVLTPTLVQDPTSKTGTWASATGTGYSGGSTWYASAAGASATYAGSGVRAFGIVTTQATSRGAFKVYVDGTLTSTVNEYSLTTTNKVLLYQVTFSGATSHTIKVVVVGTAGHPRVDVDAFVVLK